MPKLTDLNNLIDIEVTNKNEFNLNNFGLKLLKKIIKINNYNKFELPLKITSSSGSVLILIYPLFVIKIFTSEEIFNKVLTIMKIGMQSNFSVQLYSNISVKTTNTTSGILDNLKLIKNNFFALVTEKINPLIEHYDDRESFLTCEIWKNELTLMKLFIEIGDSLSYIHDGPSEDKHYTHGDTTLDNIGFKDGRFILFDFNLGFLSDGSTKEDILNFIRSTRYNLQKYNLLKNRNIKRLLDFLSNSSCKNGFQLVQSIIAYYKEYFNEDLQNHEIFNIISKQPIHTI